AAPSCPRRDRRGAAGVGFGWASVVLQERAVRGKSTNHLLSSISLPDRFHLGPNLRHQPVQRATRRDGKQLLPLFITQIPADAQRCAQAVDSVALLRVIALDADFDIFQRYALAPR